LVAHDGILVLVVEASTDDIVVRKSHSLDLAILGIGVRDGVVVGLVPLLVDGSQADGAYQVVERGDGCLSLGGEVVHRDRAKEVCVLV